MTKCICRVTGRSWQRLLIAGLCVAMLGVGWQLKAFDDNAQEPRVFEMRTYTAADGKLEDLHKRFRDHTTKLFEKHGMTNIGYWTPIEGPLAENTLVYLLAYPNMDARQKAWKGFMDDPDWKTARAESEKNGSLVTKVVSQFLKPTDYSEIK